MSCKIFFTRYDVVNSYILYLSGRIVVLREGGSNEQSGKSELIDNITDAGESNQSTIVKSGCAWIHVAHEPVVPKDVIDILHKYISGKLLIIKGKSILKKNLV